MSTSPQIVFGNFLIENPPGLLSKVFADNKYVRTEPDRGTKESDAVRVAQAAHWDLGKWDEFKERVPWYSPEQHCTNGQTLQKCPSVSDDYWGSLEDA